MQNHQNQVPLNTYSQRKISKSRHSSYSGMNRIQKIRDKRMIYPESTLNKIVFISNMEGNGFQRQNIQLYDVPAHIDLQEMIHGVNIACFNQWRDYVQALEAEPFYRYDLFQTIIGISVILVIIVFIFFILIGQIAETRILAYVFIALVILGCIGSVLLMKQKRIDINKDLAMIKTIKLQLIRLNSQEQKTYGEYPRFRWTCHRDCLWVACQFN